MGSYCFRRFLFLLFLSVCSGAYSRSGGAEKAWNLDKVSEWVLEHIRFPEEAYSFGMAGEEQMCLSVSWDGKVFLASRLNTLHPAYEQEIERVVANAPRCTGVSQGMEEAYRYVRVDFY